MHTVDKSSPSKSSIKRCFHLDSSFPCVVDVVVDVVVDDVVNDVVDDGVVGVVDDDVVVGVDGGGVSPAEPLE
jgi:hypothetical protein